MTKNINAQIICPDCRRADARIVLSCKNQIFRYECSECGVVGGKNFVDYNEDVVIGADPEEL